MLSAYGTGLTLNRIVVWAVGTFSESTAARQVNEDVLAYSSFWPALNNAEKGPTVSCFTLILEIFAYYRSLEHWPIIHHIATSNMGKKYVPLDWKPSTPNPNSFQVPPREKKVIKIRRPSGEDISTLQQPLEKNPTISTPSSHSSDKTTPKSAESEKLLTTSHTQIGDLEEFTKATSSSPPCSVSSILSQKLAKSQLELRRASPSIRAKDAPQVDRGDRKSSSISQPEVTEQIAKQQWRPDIFVHAFVPKSLTAINDSPAFIDKTTTGKGIDFESYSSTFAAPHFLPASVEPSSWQSSPIPLVDRLDYLSSVNYGQYFRDCLLLDLEAQIPELRSYDLFKVPLETLHVGHRYRLKVPGLREGTPSVDLGDFILLRQLILDPVTQLPQGMDAWLAPGGGCSRGESAPGFTKIQIRALVTAVDKINEALIIDVNGRIIPGVPVCNVSFIAQPSLVESLHRAVEDVSKELPTQFATATATALETSGNLSSERIQNNWLRSMLFPLQANGLQQTTLPSATFSQTWFDTGLNYEQKVLSHPLGIEALADRRNRKQLIRSNPTIMGSFRTSSTGPQERVRPRPYVK